ncbi:MAG TPA: hypothetical protein VNE86_03375 [Nitrososphaerales archaeon]|nr:hypothetical protein [Nitrososphaerales archaeon]
MSSQIHPLLTMSGARAEVMRRTWQQVEEMMSHGNQLSNEDFAKLVKSNWEQIKREIATIKEKEKVAKVVETTVAKDANQLGLASE